jgi:hypothetical protein
VEEKEFIIEMDRVFDAYDEVRCWRWNKILIKERSGPLSRFSTN